MSKTVRFLFNDIEYSKAVNKVYECCGLSKITLSLSPAILLSLKREQDASTFSNIELSS